MCGCCLANGLFAVSSLLLSHRCTGTEEVSLVQAGGARAHAQDNSQAFPRKREGADRKFLLGKVRSLGLSHLQPIYDAIEQAPTAKPTPKRQKRKAVSPVGAQKHQNLVGREESREYIFDRMDDEARPNFLNLE
ncbi:BQ5605_C006g04109 [Microbotryum silenes-dioicae]|uniref:BQ5605_C006g04109 protein n=1 Tax=Microbotryum silenes-dioicae TaxID=796604 RepID=A0A2X0M602_9BASI|nr:BQ5605_C006g04109 [Microbotryum silenes-dioicae]